MAGNTRKLARYQERLAKGLIHKKEPKIELYPREQMLQKIKEVCGKEYVLQLKEGKQHTAKSLFDGINQQNMVIYRQSGITDMEIIAKIQEGIDEQEKDGLLKGKFDKILSVGVKGSNKLIPKSAENKLKRKILTDLKGSIDKKYTGARLDGKNLNADELFDLQKASWAKKSNTDMMAMYGKMGITESEIREIIGMVIGSYK